MMHRSTDRKIVTAPRKWSGAGKPKRSKSKSNPKPRRAKK